MTLRTAAADMLAFLDRNPDACWPHGTGKVEALRAALAAQPVAWRFWSGTRWVYTTHDPRLILADVTPEPMHL